MNDAAHFGINSQNYNFFDEGLSKDNLLQSGKKRSEQSGLQNRTAHPIKTTQTTNFFSADLSMDILVRITGLEPARHGTPEPKSGASANSAISAYFYMFFVKNKKSL